MAKRKRTSTQTRRADARDNYDASASKLKIRSYEDIADSEDEFHIRRDKVLLDPKPITSRDGYQQDDIVEASDEEVLAYPDSNSEDGDFEDDAYDSGAALNGQGRDMSAVLGAAAAENENSEEDEISGWGASKADYYNADAIENEEDALAEEEEARRIQTKRLKALREEDFGFDETEWLAADQGGEDRGNQTNEGQPLEKLPHVKISEDMSSEDRIKLLASNYPEFEPLVQELNDLQPLYKHLARSVEDQKEVLNGQDGGDSHWNRIESTELLKFRTLSSYLGAIAMYFAILTSTASEDRRISHLMAPQDLRTHEIMDSLVQWRDVWNNVKDLPTVTITMDSEDDVAESDMSDDDVDISDEDTLGTFNGTDEGLLPISKSDGKNGTKQDSERRRAERRLRTEESLAALSNQQLSHKRRKLNAPTQAQKVNLNDEDADSDIGDEAGLTPEEVAQKAQRRKSLRFYTSQMAQKSNKRANAARATGGDEDIPYRERFRDRQERLMKEALNRGKRAGGDDPTTLRPDDDDGLEESNLERERGSFASDVYKDKAELEDWVRAKKLTKARRDEAYRQAKEEGGRVVPYQGQEIGPDGRREIGYVIEKNKGLVPKRKKEAKNPRVKKRKKFEEKTKKLRTMKPTFKGGEGRGGYQGELTGIKTNLVRGVKL